MRQTNDLPSGAQARPGPGDAGSASAVPSPSASDVVRTPALVEDGWSDAISVDDDENKPPAAVEEAYISRVVAPPLRSAGQASRPALLPVSVAGSSDDGAGAGASTRPNLASELSIFSPLVPTPPLLQGLPSNGSYYYAVSRGRQTGIFDYQWSVVNRLVQDYPDAEYHTFHTLSEASYWYLHATGRWQ
ncbi:hypothetical protein BV25DRAFT_1921192 [Artomyces pyxidatus]|uniref:Uncharacterized protein n=1 Tax=Artomyces pyxidatus TaxID=48021 RepID=A0ACB8SK77_9AGAM|nr:hypothetical protein BV25DRAFT_1921192 [Artomyces pyxidatus]